MKVTLLPVCAMTLFFYSTMQSMNSFSIAQHAGVKRHHVDFAHEQGPLKKKKLIILGQFKGVMKITKDKPWCYLNDIPQAKKIINFIKLNLNELDSHYDSEHERYFDNQLMVPITINQLDDSLQIKQENISNGFMVKYELKEAFYMHNWFPEYLPFELVAQGIEKNPLPLLIKKKSGLTKCVYTKMLLYFQDGHKDNFVAESDLPQISVELHDQFDNFFSQTRLSDLPIAVDVMELV